MRRGEVDNFLWMSSPAGVRHQPGLDGIRGLAVAAVVLFHTGLGWLPGGWLGVSLFFTLSGVVIGTVILQEIHTTRRLSLRRFWARRARRLLPAAWVVIAVVAVARLVSSRLSSTSSADVTASWLQVANWHFLVDDESYSDLFAGPSALLHYWSLAIEEQFYVVVGLLALLVATVSRRPANLLGVVAVVGGSASFALPFVFDLSVDRVYYGTDTRAGELFVGLGLAAMLSSPTWRQRIVDRARPIALVGTLALVATIAAWASIEQGSSTIRTGLLPVITTCSALIALAALIPGGPIWRLTTLRALQQLGRISYGLYLVHWPIFVVLQQAAPDHEWRHVVGVVLSIAIAVVSSRLVELPVRQRTLPLAPLLAAAGAVALVIAASVALPARQTAADEFLDDLEDAADSGTVVAPEDRPSRPAIQTDPASRTEASTAPDTVDARPTTSGPPTTAVPTTVAPARPVVGVFGDSIALTLALALVHTSDTRTFDLGQGVADIGCGVALSPFPPPERPVQCSDNDALTTATVRRDGIQVAVVMSCQWELVRQALPGSDGTERITGDPVFDDFVRAAYLHEVDVLRAAGVREVLWVRCPRPSATVGVDILEPLFRESRDPPRVARLNQLIDEVDAERDDVEVIDLAAWVNTREGDAGIRPDGSHYEFDADTGVAEELTRLIESAL